MGQPERVFRLWLAVRMGCAPDDLGQRLTAEDFNHLQVLYHRNAL